MKIYKVLGILSLSIFSVFADSTGYYCFSDKYLAYEFRFYMKGLKKPTYFFHFFDIEATMSNPIKIEVEDFQVHGMTCKTNMLIVHGWNKNHIFDLEDPNKINYTQKKHIGSQKSKRSKNLAFYSNNSTQVLRKNNITEYRLKISHTAKNKPYEYKQKVKTEILKYDLRSKKELLLRTIFEGNRTSGYGD